MSGFLEIVRCIFVEIYSIPVPGFEHITIFQLFATVWVLGFGIALIRFLLGLPMGATKDALRENFRNDLADRGIFHKRGKK